MNINFTLQKSSSLSATEIAERFQKLDYQVSIAERGVVKIRAKPIPKTFFSNNQVNTFDEFSIEREGSSLRISLHFNWVFLLIVSGMATLIVVNEFFLKQYATRPSPDILTNSLFLLAAFVFVLGKSIYDVRKEVKKALSL